MTANESFGTGIDFRPMPGMLTLIVVSNDDHPNQDPDCDPLPDPSDTPSRSKPPRVQPFGVIIETIEPKSPRPGTLREPMAWILKPLFTPCGRLNDGMPTLLGSSSSGMLYVTFSDGLPNSTPGPRVRLGMVA